MNKITIGGKQYASGVTMGALLQFKRLTGRNVEEILDTDLEGGLTLIFCCVSSHLRRDGQECPWPDVQTMADGLSAEEMNAWSTSLLSQASASADKKKAK